MFLSIIMIILNILDLTLGIYFDIGQKHYGKNQY